MGAGYQLSVSRHRGGPQDWAGEEAGDLRARVQQVLQLPQLLLR